MRSEIESFSAIVGSFYDAALDVGSWDEALARFINAYAPDGWGAGFLVWENPPAPGATFVAGAYLADFAREIYAAHYAGRNPWSRRLALQPVGKVVDTDEICPREELYESDLYKRFLSTWSMTRALAALLDRDGDRKLAFVIPGPDETDHARLRRGMRLLAPHLQRAVRISRRMAAAELRADAADAMLDRSASAFVALGADLRIVNANAAAKALEDKGVAQSRDGRWRFLDNNAQALLEQLCAAPAEASAAFTVAADGAPPYAALAIRIEGQRRAALDGFVEGAAMLLTIARKETAPTIPVDHLAAWYGLTPTEAKLASALADGSTLQAFARYRGVTEGAARFLLKGILRKTETADQARLVAALRALPAQAPDRG